MRSECAWPGGVCEWTSYRIAICVHESARSTPPPFRSSLHVLENIALIDWLGINVWNVPGTHDGRGRELGHHARRRALLPLLLLFQTTGLHFFLLTSPPISYSTHALLCKVGDVKRKRQAHDCFTGLFRPRVVKRDATSYKSDRAPCFRNWTKTRPLLKCTHACSTAR